MRCFIPMIHRAYFHFLCPLYRPQNPFRYRLYLRPLYLLLFLFLFVFASHPLLPLNGMRSLYRDIFKTVSQSPCGGDAHPVLVNSKNDMGSLPKNLIYGQHCKLDKKKSWETSVVVVCFYII